MIKDYKTYFAGKKITLMGLGLLGRGLNDAKFLAECGAELLVTDLKTAEQLKTSIAELDKFVANKKLKPIIYRLGEHRVEDFSGAGNWRPDMIIKAGGVPLDSIYIAAAEKAGVPVEMSDALFAKLLPLGVLTIGVTGTRGKSTVTQLIYEILKAAGQSVFLAGNVRGQATLPLLKKVRGGDIVVMELDSWRLQGFNTISPNISVFTNFMNDHQNYYHNNLDRYFADKANIIKHQTDLDFTFTNKQLMSRLKRLGAKSKIVAVGKNEVPANWKLKVLGEHNRENIAYAMVVAQLLGVKEAVIKKVVTNFVGLPGRMEFVCEVGGVKFYNDTNSTTPDAVIAALASLDPVARERRGGVILLGGGADKNLDYTKYVKIVSKVVKALILFKGEATEKIISSLPKNTKINVFVVDSMATAISLTKEQMQKGDVVLLSPGATSFGVFKNEYDRGDQFVAMVKKINIVARERRGKII